MKIKKVSGALGAIIDEINIKTLNDLELKELKKLFYENKVIILNNQNLNSDEYVQFGMKWGKINKNRFFKPLKDNENIAEVIKKPEYQSNVGNLWHTDHSYDINPVGISMLYAKRVPSVGGDTLFANMNLLYQSFSEPFKIFINKLSAWHESNHVFASEELINDDRYFNDGQAHQKSKHPVVIKHPFTKELCVYVNTNFTTKIDGLTSEESDLILAYIYKKGLKPEIQCRMSFKKNSLIIWDNFSTWHYAVNDYPYESRIMHRLTIENTNYLKNEEK